MTEALERLERLVIDLGGLLAEAVRAQPPRARRVDRGDETPGMRSAVSTPVEGRVGEYQLVIEAIREGYELHYGAGRIVPATDPDLALLAGDRLFALGLARLADLGDVSAVAELADLISLCAQAHAGGDAVLANAGWRAGVAAVLGGPSDDHARAKALARAGQADAAGALEAFADGRDASEQTP
ncbi:MAG TPA: hypothetical protein VHE14_02975 [Solirubrobacteraceae bacterium]|nr:hypothetical protein [Solirubrobacteraceae bacterium]